ncbi:protein-cysteine N-palmitoyltransferase Rasp-like isoform X2 [Dermacentor andersoni]|uniref:protein-cysteine N-palmitoyltransferase Rasp-like isoform X2 n=1 Tax=Dermacentor andersoni TaxID=34620 RepID=UPI0021553956|nr:protein-cysteine N-palmitoyltransferase Rasp-like isoform X2 [Dermacentor andersoni]
MSQDGRAVVERPDLKPEGQTDVERWKWNRMKVFHWVLVASAVIYAMWRFSMNEENAFLQQEKRGGFRPSPYGLQQKQDDTNWDWTTVRSVVTSNWKWFILHPLLSRATAGIAPSLVPVFYAVYTSLFVALRIGWEVALAFLGQHTAFLALSALRVPAFCYVLAFLMIVQKNFFETTFFHHIFDKYGYEAHMVTYIAFHWNILRCLSFSVDLIRAERNKPEESRTTWPPYWKTLAYVIYMPMVYLGPLQNYDDYSAQVDKPRPPCTPREIGAAILGVLRSAVHFLLMEVMTHYLYSSAMSEWPWMVGKLDPTSLVGFGLALLFFFYVHYTFAYGFAGALARAEGIEIPPRAKCIARLNRCSQFWRYFDRGMHLFIRRYFYEPVVGSCRGAGWLLLGAAASFAFTWFWHDMEKADGIFCALSLLGIALEVLVAEARKSAFAKALEGRYLATPGRMREARAFLGSPHYLLTICACMFHLAEMDVVLILCRGVLHGFPFPLVPVLVVLYSTCHISFDVTEWEATAKGKQA